MSVRHKNYIVTGAGRGIGAATAKLLASKGANLALCARTESELKGVAEDIKKSSPESKVYFRAVDLGDAAQAANFISEAQKTLGNLDGLVNNAAILVVAPADEMSVEKAREIFAVNVITPFSLSKEFFKSLKQAKRRGAIVNIGSVAGLQGFEKFPGLSLYSATKAALVAMTESLAVEGREFGIRVNLVAPGATDTRMLKQAIPDYPVQMKPENIAKAICFFLDDEESGLITGSIMSASDS